MTVRRYALNEDLQPVLVASDCHLVRTLPDISEYGPPAEGIKNNV